MDTVADMTITPLRLLAVLAVLVTAAPVPVLGQDGAGNSIIPSNSVVITGYGTVGYLGRSGENADPNTFSASFSPIFLYQFLDRIMFEAELEFDVADGVTETGLEYAQLDVIAGDNVTFIGGKFLVPFGVFGDRLHPTWINKFATPPPFYGHHTSEFGAEPILPILSDLGVMAKATVTPGPWQLTLNGYVTQGPSIEAGHDEEDGEEAAIPEFDFLGSTGDTNDSKMVGGRLDIALPPWMELNLSVLNADYDVNNVLDFTAWNVAAEFRNKGWEARGEYIQTRQEFETEEGFPQLVRSGIYSQVSYRTGQWEPVFRFTKTFNEEIDGEVEVGSAAWQAAGGLDYWFGPSVALMGGFEINREEGIEFDNDRFVIHMAFGY